MSNKDIMKILHNNVMDKHNIEDSLFLSFLFPSILLYYIYSLYSYPILVSNYIDFNLLGLGYYCIIMILLCINIYRNIIIMKIKSPYNNNNNILSYSNTRKYIYTLDLCGDFLSYSIEERFLWDIMGSSKYLYNKKNNKIR